METNYKALFEQHRNKYNLLINELNEMKMNDTYKDAVNSASFEFLRALYLAKRIDIYTNSEEGRKPVFIFTSAQEALSTYADIVNFPKMSEKLLSKAVIINQVDRKISEINDLVKSSDYLTSDYLIEQTDTQVNNLAKEVLSLIPKTEKSLNKELRLDILKDICNQFNSVQVGHLADKKMFRISDIDNLVKVVTTDNGKANIKALCNKFNLDVVPVKTEVLRIKGCTFNNEDGTSRQGNIRELETYINANGIAPALRVENFTYKPEIGEEEPAARIIWGDKELGVLPRDVAIELHNSYADKIITAKANKILGGGNVSYGVEITLDICEKAKVKEQELELG